MWVKRTPEEIAMAKCERNRGRIRGSIFLGVFTFMLTLFLNGFSRRSAPKPFFTTTEELQGRLPISVIGGIVCGLLYFFANKGSTPTVVCPKCDTIKSPDGNFQCKCGGHFENIEEMKWHEHKK
jgi:hypothetical protein